MADNIDVFKKVIFSIPPMKTVIATVIVSGCLYGVLVNFFLSSVSPLELSVHYIIETILMVFVIPTLIAGEIYHLSFEEYPRKWSYFIALFSEFILFIYGMILSAAEPTGIASSWNIFWLAVITVFLISMIVLISTLGYKNIKRITILSLAHPLMIIATYHIFLGREQDITYVTYVEKLGVFFLTGIAILLVFLLAEYLISTNVNVSAIKLFSGMMHKKQEILDLGYFVKPDVQTLLLKNENGESIIAIPWIHPGPLEGFGGGRASTDIINHLNNNSEGFFLHVPSTHKSDPANPHDIDKIIEAFERPETVGQASKLLKKDYGKLIFYGRKWGDQKIVYMEAEEYGDYEIPVFTEILDLNKVVIIDLHNHERNKEPKDQLMYGTVEAEHFRNCLKDFLDELDKCELYDYRAGFATEVPDTPKFALIEEVADQKVLIFGTEGNGISHEMMNIARQHENEFDEIIMFTTDTHSSIHNMIADRHVDPESLKEVIERAGQIVSKASAGFTSKRAEPMKLLKDDYLGLAYSINILARLIPLTLFLLYIALILWIL
ncbi:MAG: hypothetical protein CI953_1337 [Methanohalophilus sp.]|jgi:putative membrane protein|nr:MAG: hypothetical protein CI953_1337 [Methanohalophilus sp.]